ncbi:DNA mismatch repair protein MutL [Anaerovibrio sp. JC8]|uniref:DNA mismatch repair endonuclease MutL n=1 Tax=Anaerovibrio sp. JC8 TaxID=1240085 RepID=UPI000A0CFADD|nr:DNA mismatch repair endonuclease MutL [Anaerovibrio sp. JC8]ORU00719.1 DNA mismatch repair protein MutL [Anaerovibrio sp. JC8]
MSFVHVLDDSTINKIAAGEVVERPASVIKELIENAMDAKADRIEVEIMAGGTSFMRVSDNGIGMSMEDAKMAIRRHATSKIFKVEDLMDIDTLGFRGEALPSISAVSRFTLQTRQAGAELGTEVKIIGGKEPEIGEAGCSLGTTIRVEDLFFNTPARKKFMKTNNTEASKINEFIIKLAISRPDIAFKFINNNKTSVVTPGNGNLHDTLRSIYGGSVGDALLGMDFADADISIRGYISKPSTIRSNRNWQTFIVNGRIISNRAMSKAVDNAYASLIPKSGYPMVALIMEVAPNSIDVNVHPQKSEIKFEDEGRIFKAVYKAVLDAVRPHGQALGNIAAQVERPERHFTGAPASMKEAKPVMEPLIDDMHFVPAQEPKTTVAAAVSHSYTPSSLPSSAYQYRVEQQAKTLHEAQMEIHNNLVVDTETGEILEPSAGGVSANEVPATEPAASTTESVSAASTEAVSQPAVNPVESASPSSPMVPIGQVDNTYIIAQDAKGLYIIDQHAAHERILYDRFAAMTERIPSQQLLVHLFLDFSSRESQLIEENLELFHSLGFGLEQSGPDQYRLMEIPADIPVGEAENIIREILTSLEDMHQLSAAEIRHECLAMTACKAAIKAGFELNFRQMEIILEELNKTAMPYTCPHGRPTILKFSSDELAKMFKRTGF